MLTVEQEKICQRIMSEVDGLLSTVNHIDPSLRESSKGLIQKNIEEVFNRLEKEGKIMFSPKVGFKKTPDGSLKVQLFNPVNGSRVEALDRLFHFLAGAEVN